MKSNTIKCDLCGQPIGITRDSFDEIPLSIEKDGVVYSNVYATMVTCPHCGKTFIAQLDDDETLCLLSEAKSLYMKKLTYLSKRKPVPVKIAYRCGKLDAKLSFKRQELAKKLDGALYQFEGDTIQLEYRHHVR